MIVDRDRRLVAVLHRPDDVLRTPGGVTAEENAGARTREGGLVDDRHVLIIEADTGVALDPGECVLLADGEDYRITREHDRLDDLTPLLPVLLEPAQPLHLHADELPILDDEPLRPMVLDDLDALFFGVLELPRRRFEIRTRASRDDLDVLSA